MKGTLASAVLLAVGVVQSEGGGWTTLHGNAQRHGFYSWFPEGQLELVWRKELHEEMTGPRAEVISDGERVYLGTYAGNLYAWHLETGEEMWRFRSGGAIGHSPTVAGGLVVFGSLDGNLYGLEAETGNVRWVFEAGAGIWVSPLAAGDMILFGTRGGDFVAVDLRSGAERWRFAIGDRILQSASLSEDGGSVLVGAEDMHLYCLDAGEGRLKWKSGKLHGLSLRDYFPVVVGDKVLVTTNPVKDFHTILGEHEQRLLEWAGPVSGDRRYVPRTREKVREEQRRIVEFLKEHPEEQTFYVFNVADGKEPFLLPVLYSGGLHNPMSPPCYDPERGQVFLWVRSAYGVWDGGGEVRSFTSPARWDVESGEVTLLEHGYESGEAGRPPGAKDTPWMAFNYIGDETQTLSCSASWLFSSHQGFLGSMNLETGRLLSRFGKRDTYGGFYGPGNFGWENQGGVARARAAGEPFGIVNEWHGPARSIASVAGGYVLYHVGGQVLCLAEEGSR